MSRRPGRPAAALLACLAALTACGVPVPEDKQLYVGQWDAADRSLRIDADGSVHYERQAEHGLVSVKGPIQAFHDEDFSVGLPFLSTRFRVSQPPWLEKGRWRMVVDGVELVRDGQPFAGRSAEFRGFGVTIHDQGILGRLRSDGSRALVQSTTLVPAEVGRVFGVSFSFHNPEGRSAVLTFRCDSPPAPASAGHDASDNVIHAAIAPGGPYQAWCELEEPRDLIPGEWRLYIYEDDRLLARRKFQLQRPRVARTQ